MVQLYDTKVRRQGSAKYGFTWVVEMWVPPNAIQRHERWSRVGSAKTKVEATEIAARKQAEARAASTANDRQP